LSSNPHNRKKHGSSGAIRLPRVDCRDRLKTMTETQMKKFALTLGVATAALAATIALAGPGYGPGNGPGAGTGCAAGTGTNCQGGMGPGMGMGGGEGHGRGAGLNLMTPDERVAHRNQMMSLKNVDECNAYLAAHRAAMADRAAKQGVTLPEPRGNACERMQAHGRFG
jgi:hypothetical protein